MSYIVNIGIKSKLGKYVLCNFRFGSSMALNTGSNKVEFCKPGNASSTHIVGLRSSSDELPKTFKGTNVEFDLDYFKQIFAENVKYSTQCKSLAVLMKSHDYLYNNNPMTYRYYKVGMTMFSRLNPGINAASIYTKGELNFAFRNSDGGEGQLECDIYDRDNNPIGLIDYITDSGTGSYKTLAYGNTPAEIEKNKNILSQLIFKSEIVLDYGSSYPKKRIMLTISDEGTPSQSVLEAKPEESTSPDPVLYTSTQQATVYNKTDKCYFQVVNVNDTHGSWTSHPAVGDTIYPPNGSFQLGMTSKGHGIQGEVSCDVYYKLNDEVSIQVARLIVEINNDGIAFALFPFVNDQAVSDKLVANKFKNTLYVKNEGLYSLSVNS